MNDENKKELIKEKIKEQDKAKLKYKQKIELVKQHYGIEFDVEHFKDENIETIKFVNLEYKNVLRNIVVIYDNSLQKFNYVSYDYDNESTLKNLNNKKILTGVSKENKLKLVVGEMRRLNEEYQNELKIINDKYSSMLNNNIESENELQLKKKDEN
ncbi:MAG: hypothetical protein J6B64_03080 [Bacilli bacterium]|nr:hypothetical protein [Bacilli bacterium]MBO5376365.1 hypothetical protein [Bacilli bacterium]MBP3597616.1 hypothetical protein [Clostridia bacterium]